MTRSKRSEVREQYFRQMARLRLASGATEEEFVRLDDKAKKLGLSKGFPIDKIAEVMGNLACAGFGVETILETIDSALVLNAMGAEHMIQNIARNL